MEYLPSFTDSLRADIQPSYTDSLMHHGIKGQKWGVRRFQNPDGSYTSAGKNRYSNNSSNNSKFKINKRAVTTAAGAAIAAAGIAYLTADKRADIRADKAVSAFNYGAMQYADEVYDKHNFLFKANLYEFKKDLPSIDSETCRNNAKRAREDAQKLDSDINKACNTYERRVSKRMLGKSFIGQRQKFIQGVQDTRDRIQSDRVGALRDMADMYDHMAKELDARRKPKSYNEEADEFRKKQVAKWKQEKKEREKQEAEKSAEQRRKSRDIEYKIQREKEAYDKWKDDQDYWSSH